MPVFNQSTGTFNSVAPAQAAGIAAPQAPPPALLPAAHQSNQLRPIGGGQQSHPPVMPKPISIGKSLIGGSEEEEPEPSLKPVQPVQPGQNNLLPAGYTAITLPNGQPGYEINGRQYTEYGNPVSALPQQIAYTPPQQNQNQQSAYHQTPIDYQQVWIR
jgi:hypothetical protein